MASTINATSTGSGGLITTGNSVNQLELQTGDTTRMVIDSSGNVTIQGQGDLRLADSDSSHYIALQAPGTVASNVTFTLPSADGTSGQVIQTNGSGTLSFVTPSSNWAVVSTINIVSGDASAVFTVGSDYNIYAISLSNCKNAASENLLEVFVSTDGGSTYVSSYSYGGLRNSTTSAFGVNQSANIAYRTGVEDPGIASNEEGVYGWIYVYDPSNTTRQKQIVSWTNYYNSGAAPTVNMFYGSAATTSAINRIKFQWQSGNFGSGRLVLYGIKTS
jgi:hypothetical protein